MVFCSDSFSADRLTGAKQLPVIPRLQGSVQAVMLRFHFQIDLIVSKCRRTIHTWTIAARYGHSETARNPSAKFACTDYCAVIRYCVRVDVTSTGPRHLSDSSPLKQDRLVEVLGYIEYNT